MLGGRGPLLIQQDKVVEESRMRMRMRMWKSDQAQTESSVDLTQRVGECPLIRPFSTRRQFENSKRTIVVSVILLDCLDI